MEPSATATPPTIRKKSWWHPNYAFAIAMVFAASVAAFLISPEATGFVTAVWVYVAAMAIIIFVTSFFWLNAANNDSTSFGLCALIASIATVGVGLSLLYSLFD